MSEQPPTGISLARAAVQLSYVEASWVLEQAGIPSLSIKGPVTSALLRDPSRVFSDADILVPAAVFERAVAALNARGWLVVNAGLGEQEKAQHSVTLQRPTGVPVRTELDLHTTFPGFAATPERLWEVLVRDAKILVVAHKPLRVPSGAAALLFVALHAARSGVDVGKPLTDLRRAIEVVPPRLWATAAGIAEELGAAEALSAALSLTPDGQRIAKRLDLSPPGLEWVLRSRGDSGLAMFVLAWARAPWRRKLPLLAREVWPTRAFMRIDWLDPQDHGPSALLRAHLRRWDSVLRRLPGTLGAMASAARAARRVR